MLTMIILGNSLENLSRVIRKLKFHKMRISLSSIFSEFSCFIEMLAKRRTAFFPSLHVCQCQECQTANRYMNNLLTGLRKPLV